MYMKLTEIYRVHRLSLPSSNYNGQYRPNVSGYGSNSGVNNSFAGTKHLFPSDEEKPFMRDEDRLSTPDIKGYIRMTDPDDKFPTLSRRGGSNIVSPHISVPSDCTEFKLTVVEVVC
jgi:hypothetical protein